MCSALDAARAFFRLPYGEKMAVEAPRDAGNACLRGFVPYGSSLQRSTDLHATLAPAGAGAQKARTPDRKESFTVGVHRFCDLETRAADDERDKAYFQRESADGRFFAHNRWPAGGVGEELRVAWRAYFDDVAEPLVRTLYDLIAEALGMDAAVFHRTHGRHFSECRCNYYLEVVGEDSGVVPPALPGQRRISAHKDFTDFTILAPDPSASYPHLQIAARDGESYRMVPFDETCLTVLLGEPMQKWSNDRWFAPLHRVDLPSKEDEMGAKYTMAYFRNPDYETVIAAPAAAADRVYPDITVQEHWWGMYNRSSKAFGVDLTSRTKG
jgi:isopenicillin N synthase-like dioxygenase